MKFTKIFVLSASLLLATGGLISCNNSTPSVESSAPTSSVEALQSIPAQFSPGDGDAHASKAVEATKKVRMHYHRFDDQGDYTHYLNWSLWIWDATNGLEGKIVPFDHYDDYGVYVDIDLSEYGDNMEKFGFIVCCYENGKWYGKDVEMDRFIEIDETAPGGIQDAFIVSGTDRIYTDPANSTKPFIKAVRITGALNTVRIAFDANKNPFTFDQSKLTLLRNGTAATDYVISETGESFAIATFSSDLDLSDKIEAVYDFGNNWTDRSTAVITDLFDSEDFINNYYYEGDDLGATFDNEANPTKTTFKVWAPTTKEIKLNLYRTGDYRKEEDATPYRIIDMVRGQKGVWSATVDEDLDGVYYTYSVVNSAGSNEVVDPYAKSAGLNGRRGMVVNFTKLNAALEGWANDKRPEIENLAASSIYEIHVRDMTINPNSGVTAENRGKYLGLTETGTKYEEGGKSVTTGLDHLAELGVTHVQIQPFYDYASVDESNPKSEMSATNYNWGYDPQNYNCLEGSYSSNPSDGYARIKEFKQMVMAMHEKGLNINMDVVYNHTFSINGSFQMLVPYYYYRTSNSGVFYNGSGCGNEVASNRLMMRKFIVESTAFYTDEYHLSGFRFDLMGLEDNQTMIDVYKAVTAIYPQALVYGEPWEMGSLKSTYNPAKLSEQKTLQKSLSRDFFYGEGNYVGAFNDGIRGAIRGDNSPSKGFVQGSGTGVSLLSGIQGLFNTNDATLSPIQSINYASCHDNYTLFDQLIKTTPETRVFDDVYTQANAIVGLSEGIAFFQEGDDFMRTKRYTAEDGTVQYEDNSYNVGDFINHMDYALKLEKLATFENTKELIKVRGEHGALTLPTRELIASNLTGLEAKDGIVSYTVTDGKETLFVVHANAEGTIAKSGSVVYDNSARLTAGESVTSLSLAPNETVVLKLS